VGHVTRVPVVRYEGDGHAVASFTLAISEASRDGKAYVLYVPCIASWGKAAEACSLLSAEDMVSVQGKLTWHKKVGRCKQEHSTLVVRVQDIQTLAPAEMPA
jgi:single-stranded DNA-binding protein